MLMLRCLSLGVSVSATHLERDQRELCFLFITLTLWRRRGATGLAPVPVLPVSCVCPCVGLCLWGVWVLYVSYCVRVFWSTSNRLLAVVCGLRSVDGASWSWCPRGTPPNMFLYIYRVVLYTIYAYAYAYHIHIHHIYTIHIRIHTHIHTYIHIDIDIVIHSTW